MYRRVGLVFGNESVEVEPNRALGGFDFEKLVAAFAGAQNLGLGWNSADGAIAAIGLFLINAYEACFRAASFRSEKDFLGAVVVEVGFRTSPIDFRLLALGVFGLRVVEKIVLFRRLQHAARFGGWRT